MPRKMPEVTVLIREKGKRKFERLEIFDNETSNGNLIQVKYNNRWFKNKKKFPLDKIGGLFTNTVKKILRF